MKIILNGEQTNFSSTITISGVIEHLQLPEQSFIVELNGEIIARNIYATHRLHAGDQLEIVRFVGGG
jgi:thiamine biosynthesis protein ThiS